MTNILGKSEKRFQVIIHIILIFMALAAILPLWVLVAGSVTGEQELTWRAILSCQRPSVLMLTNIFFIKLQRSSGLTDHRIYHSSRYGSQPFYYTASGLSALKKRL